MISAKKITYSIGGLIILGACLFGWKVFDAYDSSQTDSVETQTNGFAICEEKNKEIKSQAYDCFRDFTIAFMQDGGTVNDLYALRAQSLGYQHIKEHAISAAAFVTSGKDWEKAIALCPVGDQCAYAYLHALTQEMATAGIDESEIDRLTDTVCGTHDFSCLHAVGHYFGEKHRGDLLEAARGCEKYEHEESYVNCFDGAIHEWLIQAEVPEEIFSICPEHEQEYGNDLCYRYASHIYIIWMKGKKPETHSIVAQCDAVRDLIPDKSNQCYTGIYEYVFYRSVDFEEICQASEYGELCRDSIVHLDNEEPRLDGCSIGQGGDVCGLERFDTDYFVPESHHDHDHGDSHGHSPLNENPNLLLRDGTVPFGGN